MKAIRTRHGWVHMFTTHRPTLTLQLYNFDLFRTCRTALLRGNWQDFNWHDASRGPSAIGDLLVYSTFRLCVLATPVSPAKTDEPMETPSRRQTCVGPRNYTVVKKTGPLRNFQITLTKTGQNQYFCTGSLQGLSNVYICRLWILMKQGTSWG